MLMKRRKFADGGETTEMMPSAKPEGGRFDEDTYARARRFMESGGKKEETKTAVKKARKVEVEPTAEKTKNKTPAKRPGMMARLRADSVKREAAVKRMREETPDLSAAPPRTTDNPMGKNYGAGRVNPNTLLPYKKGGDVKKYAEGGMVGSASRRADGVATKGKTKCRIV
jgi:hypothetical protein